MKVIIDTNSLLSLVRYYLPFDKKGILFNFFKKKIEEGEIIVIDKVYTQCLYTSKGIILKKLDFLLEKPFLKSAKAPRNTELILAPNTKKFFHLMNSAFVNNIVRKSRNITDVEFETLKNSHIEDADMKMILLCLNMIANGEKEVVIVTEETSESNDNKLFKKIPAMCKELEIRCITLPELIELYEEIDLHFK